jgi:predicted RNA-binding Zn-ribbon protein involved in translation (DUF1610 family)
MVVKKMPYCPKCGIELPKEKGARFCPNCGSPIPRSLLIEKRKISWINVVKERIPVFLVTFMLCLAATAIGTLARVDRSEATRIFHEIEEQTESIKKYGFHLIFTHNLRIMLVMFVPAFGPLWGFTALYNTGRILAAFSMLYGINPLIIFLSLLPYPFVIMEYTSYALAISESLMLTRSIIKRDFKNGVIVALVVMAVCIIALILAAIAEWFYISAA